MTVRRIDQQKKSSISGRAACPMFIHRLQMSVLKCPKPSIVMVYAKLAKFMGFDSNKNKESCAKDNITSLIRRDLYVSSLVRRSVKREKCDEQRQKKYADTIARTVRDPTGKLRGKAREITWALFWGKITVDEESRAAKKGRDAVTGMSKLVINIWTLSFVKLKFISGCKEGLLDVYNWFLWNHEWLRRYTGSRRRAQ